MIAAELVDIAFALEPALHDRVTEQGRRPAAFGPAAPPAFRLQQPGDVLNECMKDVEHGTMGNRVEPSGP